MPEATALRLQGTDDGLEGVLPIKPHARARGPGRQPFPTMDQGHARPEWPGREGGGDGEPAWKEGDGGQNNLNGPFCRIDVADKTADFLFVSLK